MAAIKIYAFNMDKVNEPKEVLSETEAKVGGQIKIGIMFKPIVFASAVVDGKQYVTYAHGK